MNSGKKKPKLGNGTGNLKGVFGIRSGDLTWTPYMEIMENGHRPHGLPCTCDSINPHPRCFCSKHGNIIGYSRIFVGENLHWTAFRENLFTIAIENGQRKGEFSH